MSKAWYIIADKSVWMHHTLLLKMSLSNSANADMLSIL